LYSKVLAVTPVIAIFILEGQNECIFSFREEKIRRPGATSSVLIAVERYEMLANRAWVRTQEGPAYRCGEVVCGSYVRADDYARGG
jgi:hypothetical protein